MDSTALEQGEAFEMWLPMHPQAEEIPDGSAILREAFTSGYALAQSQSTQGTGEWEPKT